MTLLYRRLRYGYAFRRIPLTKGKYAIVDPEDYTKLSKHKWQASSNPLKCYAQRTGSGKKGRNITVIMHREILKVPKGIYVDHINHNPLDNRKANLRAATAGQSCQNRRKCTTRITQSKYKGLVWRANRKRWEVRLRANNKIRFLGSFENEIDAARAYDRAAKEYHGEFASLNFES
ncbi:MAG: HNH endonuclease [Planctomycetota bacterium]|jgi:hypothetical protein